jgi:hypothetical protein
MRERFKHDRNRARPLYHGIKLRAKGPPKLAVVSTIEQAA